MRTSDNTQISELRNLIAQLAPREGSHHTAITSLSMVSYSSTLTRVFVWPRSLYGRTGRASDFGAHSGGNARQALLGPKAGVQFDKR